MNRDEKRMEIPKLKEVRFTWDTIKIIGIPIKDHWSFNNIPLEIVLDMINREFLLLEYISVVLFPHFLEKNP